VINWEFIRQPAILYHFLLPTGSPQLSLGSKAAFLLRLIHLMARRENIQNDGGSLDARMVTVESFGSPCEVSTISVTEYPDVMELPIRYVRDLLSSPGALLDIQDDLYWEEAPGDGFAESFAKDRDNGFTSEHDQVERVCTRNLTNYPILKSNDDIVAGFPADLQIPNSEKLKYEFKEYEFKVCFQSRPILRADSGAEETITGYQSHKLF
jgi:hypothetical protein